MKKIALWRLWSPEVPEDGRNWSINSAGNKATDRQQSRGEIPTLIGVTTFESKIRLKPRRCTSPKGRYGEGPVRRHGDCKAARKQHGRDREMCLLKRVTNPLKTTYSLHQHLPALRKPPTVSRIMMNEYSGTEEIV